MTKFKLRVTKARAHLYHVEIQFASWKDEDTWVCFEHFKSKRTAKSFVVQAILSGSPFDPEIRTRALKENCSTLR